MQDLVSARQERLRYRRQSRWNWPSFATILPFGDVGRWIVDRELAAEAIDATTRAGIQLSFTDQ